MPSDAPPPAPRNDTSQEPRVGLLQTVASVAASFFGVQSRRNRERDFARGKAGHFIAVGIGMTVMFVLVVALAVKFALRSAGL
ncbi:MAG TPA: DUF2970 domain-containing protein [Solimonas sp.]